ncbi:DUF6236 family protein [Streptomyces mirabilis]|uniref:DUF6236 family protein n=1 Tax=Streptomyces mirabilis TaxID=68239 RepID=UPI002E225691
MGMMQRMGLYYPYIHFRSEKWLKLAALYWPQIARVVPQDYMTRDSRTARVLADKLDFVIDVPPDGSAAAVAGIFIEAIERDVSQLRSGLGVFAADRVISPDNVHVADRAANSWDGPVTVPGELHPFRPLKRLAGVYHAEVAPPLREALTETGLALETSREIHAGTAARRPGHWLAMDPRLAWAYKCALTEHLARVNSLEPLTDGIAAYALTRPWTADYVLELLNEQGSAPGDRSATGQLEDFTAVDDTATRVAMLAMQLVVPQDLNAVTAEQIVAVRTGCGAEFDAFRDAVTAAADELADLSTETADPAIVAAYLDQIVTQRFKQPLASLRSAMHGLNVDTTLSAASMKFELPAAVAALGGTMASQPAVATAGGLAFALIGLGRSWKQGWAARRGASPESYLLRVEKGLKPRSLLTRVRNPRRHDTRTT